MLICCVIWVIIEFNFYFVIFQKVGKFNWIRFKNFEFFIVSKFNKFVFVVIFVFLMGIVFRARYKVNQVFVIIVIGNVMDVGFYGN